MTAYPIEHFNSKRCRTCGAKMQVSEATWQNGLVGLLVKWLPWFEANQFGDAVYWPVKTYCANHSTPPVSYM